MVLKFALTSTQLEHVNNAVMSMLKAQADKYGYLPTIMITELYCATIDVIGGDVLSTTEKHPDYINKFIESVLQYNLDLPAYSHVMKAADSRMVQSDIRIIYDLINEVLEDGLHVTINGESIKDVNDIGYKIYNQHHVEIRAEDADTTLSVDVDNNHITCVS